ncbi:MAG: DUF4340 domain-containing protein [Nitrospinae bacterium]|nr:DUF4340 domain-containing protein [Nitrospinota bacterium]
MKGRRIWIASLTLAALGGIYYYLGHVKTGADGGAKSGPKLLDLDTAKAGSITIKKGAGTIVLEKAGAEWRITGPVKALAAAGAVDAIIIAASGLERGEDIGPAPNLADYGLENPDSVTFAQSGGSQTIKVGAVSPAGHGRYVMVDGSPNVYMVHSHDADDIFKNLFDLRERKLFRAKLSDVKSLTVKKGSAEITVEKSDAGWNLAKPAQGALDAGEVEQYLSKTLAAVADEFVEDNLADMKQYGLDRPAASITINTETLLIGSPTVKGGRYATMAGSGTLVRIPEDVHTSAPETPDMFRDLSLVKFDKNTVTKITLAAPGWKLSAETEKKKKESDETRWRIVEPQGKEADTAAIESILFELERARGTKLADAQAGVADLKMTITAGGKDKTVSLYSAAEKSSGRHYALSDDGKKYVELDGNTFNALNVKPSTFFDVRYFPVRSDEVGRIVISRHGQVFDIARKGDVYKMTGPEQRDINPESWSGLVWALTSLRCENAGKSRQNKPAIVMSVYDTLGNLVDEVTVAGRAPGGAYAATSRKRGADCGVPERFVTGDLIKILEDLMTR